MHKGEDFMTSQLAWKPIVAQYATYTSVKWKLETSSAHTWNHGKWLHGHRFCPKTCLGGIFKQFNAEPVLWKVEKWGKRKSVFELHHWHAQICCFLPFPLRRCVLVSVWFDGDVVTFKSFHRWTPGAIPVFIWLQAFLTGFIHDSFYF